MFRKPPSDTITKVNSADSLQQIVVNLDEHQEESLSGGITPIIDPILIEKMKYPSKRFPCDGPGRGGICTQLKYDLLKASAITSRIFDVKNSGRSNFSRAYSQKNLIEKGDRPALLPQLREIRDIAQNSMLHKHDELTYQIKSEENNAA